MVNEEEKERLEKQKTQEALPLQDDSDEDQESIDSRIGDFEFHPLQPSAHSSSLWDHHNIDTTPNVYPTSSIPSLLDTTTYPGIPLHPSTSSYAFPSSYNTRSNPISNYTPPLTPQDSMEFQPERAGVNTTRYYLDSTLSATQYTSNYTIPNLHGTDNTSTLNTAMPYSTDSGVSGIYSYSFPSLLKKVKKEDAPVLQKDYHESIIDSNSTRDCIDNLMVNATTFKGSLYQRTGFHGDASDRGSE